MPSSYGLDKEIVRQKGLSNEQSLVNSIVALEPAVNPRVADNNLPSTGVEPPFINFGAVAKHSFAFVSSQLGSENIADTANTFIRVQSNQGGLIEKHGFAVTLFSDILDKERNGVHDPKIMRFYASAIIGATNSVQLAQQKGAEGTIFTSIIQDSRDPNWFKAQFSNFSF